MIECYACTLFIIISKVNLLNENDGNEFDDIKSTVESNTLWPTFTPIINFSLNFENGLCHYYKHHVRYNLIHNAK